MRDRHERELTAALPDDGPWPVSVDTDAPDWTSAEVTRFLDELRSFGRRRAPPPSAALAALLAGAVPMELARRRRAMRRSGHGRSVAVAVLGIAAASLTVLAAANDRLPQPAQGFVSRVVNDLTPLHIDATRGPVPSRERPRPARPLVPVAPVAPIAPVDSTSPVAQIVRSPAPVPSPAPAPSAPADDEGPAGDDSSAPPSSAAPSEPDDNGYGNDDHHGGHSR